MFVRGLYSNYAEGSKMPRLHPIIQLLISEWRSASEQSRLPKWSLFTEDYIANVCREVGLALPLWHPDLFATDIAHYMNGMLKKDMWWLPDIPVVQEGSDGAS